MKFEISRYRKSERTHSGLRQGFQCGVQVVGKQAAVIAVQVHPILGDFTGGEGRRTHAAGLITAALLVRPGYDLDRDGRFNAGILECFQNLEGSQRSQCPVEASPW